ncbi:amidohydrolase family protein [Pseudoclavibacter chungangensis]|uniref:Amidohydrolase family protein n=1 Tax=Pseudoclavibacter chungangensis TaxID=587635 RepID=A0A7J5BRA8_9MICO|nr:amidohydrolase family protein [Pseudoclavibacter chungangensis]KAB1656800.1 amidohydrolase family protein [Pseudoclavibacter chungangensis]NYJ67249.1 hypothetical protein [Pseudoclavibacter chungangensis]
MSTPESERARFFAGLELVDHHCHGVVRDAVDRAAFEDLITESDVPAPAGATQFDSQLGFGIRAHCAPLLDLDAFATPEQYLDRRAVLGPEEVNRRLLAAAGTGTYLVETGHRGDLIASPAEMARLAAARAYEVVRLERLAEELVERGVSAASFRAAFEDELTERLRTAVGTKSIAAYRIGLDFDPSKPSDDEVDAAVAAWVAERGRLESAVVVRWLIWTAVERGTVLQFHVGYGDPDVDLHRCSPLLLTEFLRRTRDTGTRITLLHCYPFHREAGYLAQVFPHVWFDVGLAINYVGSRSEAVIAESLELAPFHKILYSSDAWGAAELYTLGALLFRRGLDHALARFAELDAWPWAEQRRVAERIGSRNARAVYRLDEATEVPA